MVRPAIYLFQAIRSPFGANHELAHQRRPAEDPQHPAPRDAGESVDQMSGFRTARVLQGRRGQPVRDSRLELPHAHGRGGAAEIDLRQRDLVRRGAARGVGRSPEIPRRAQIRRPHQGCPRPHRAERRHQGRLRQARRRRRRDRGAGLRLHGRLARHGGGRGDRARARARGREEIAVHRVRGLRRRPHAGRHLIAHADAANDRRHPDAARSETALHRGADQSDHRRRHRLLRDAGRRADRRARRADRIRRRARDRTDHPREIAGRLSACGISQGPRHGRHGRASSRAAPDAGAPLPAADEIAGAGNRLETRSCWSPLRPRSYRARTWRRQHPTRERARGQASAPARRIDRAAVRPASGADRARPGADAAAPGAARPSRTQAAAGHSRRRHQWQGFDDRVFARDPGSRRPACPRLHLALAGADQRTLSPRPARWRRSRRR